MPRKRSVKEPTDVVDIPCIPPRTIVTVGELKDAIREGIAAQVPYSTKFYQGLERLHIVEHAERMYNGCYDSLKFYEAVH